MYVADTCIGGLSVLKALWREGLASQAVFMADYATNPLGVKSDSAIGSAVAHWLEQAAKISDTLVIACNTLSIRYEQMPKVHSQATSGLKVVSMVDCLKAMLEFEAGWLASKKVLVVGTAFTAKQALYAEIVNRVVPDACVDTVAATELERRIARFEPWAGVRDDALTTELRTAIGNSDVAILACTCFPMVKADLEALFPDVVFLDPGAYCSGLLTTRNGEPRRKLSIEVTGDEVPATSVIAFARSFLDEESIEKYRSQ